jgi:hypothetical protein
VIDGPALVNMLHPRTAATFAAYAEEIFLPHIQKQAPDVTRIDVVFYVYKKDSLKSYAHAKSSLSEKCLPLVID